MSAVTLGVFIFIAYIGLGVAMHVLSKPSRSKILSDRTADAVTAKSIAPFADWRPDAERDAPAGTRRGDVIAPFAR